MSFTITQNLFVNDSTAITVVKCDEDALKKRHLRDLLDVPSHVLGVAATYGEHCRVSSVAFSTLSRALVVKISSHRVSQRKHQPGSNQRRITRSRSLVQDFLLCNPQFHKYAFRMDQLAVALYTDLSIRISDAVDMLSVSIAGRHSLEALMDAMGGEEILYKESVKSLFFDASESLTIDAAAQLALKAWAACRAATLPDMSFASLPRINTMAFPKAHIVTIASISRNADRLEALKPTDTKNDVSRDRSTVKKGAINLLCDRFPTRIRKSKTQVIQIEIEGKGTKSQVTGRARRVDGRTAHISVNGPLHGDKVVSVTTIGKDDPTCADSAREAIILAALQHKSNILSNPFFQALWLPRERPVHKSKEQKGSLTVLSPFLRPPNPSQEKAIRKILSDEESDQIVLIQGPPGTGKTSVIASSVIRFNSDRNTWVVAQSNVAVRNIAEKFIKDKFYKFKLLVSRDFHYDWHEDLYEELEQCFIRSDRFKMSVVAASRMLLDCKVILCTVGMLSNPHIDVFLRVVPVETVIIDEASQIECGDYLPVFHRFNLTLKKLVFIGDNKQLPPYGQEDIPQLRSVFEFLHLRKQALFLDTQYRMPHVIGNFISCNVYGGKLRTQHDCTNPEACRFIDVNKGQESKRGLSWINDEEARIVVKLAQLYESKNMPFRIITPYDAQRSLIEKCLKSDKLIWKDKVFNVDSFQGNEDEHIIVSVVRSQRTGFLRNQRRTNVMLTRCKRSMVICSSRKFLLGKASDTLVGKLAASLGDATWVNANDVVRGRFCLFP